MNIYIYIYREREREREKNVLKHLRIIFLTLSRHFFKSLYMQF